MKKDYIAIAEEQTHADEDSFVEDFWTRRWDTITRLPKANSITKREEFRIMQSYLQQLKAGSRILDGGCGMGEWTVQLSSQGFQVIGLDISEQTIARLQALLPDYQFTTGDIRHTDFEDATFDAYFSWGTFEHFEIGLGDCVKEAYRILKPGGYLFVSVPYQNIRHLLQSMRWRPRKHSDSHSSKSVQPSPRRFYQWRLTKAELAQELQMQGFQVFRIEPVFVKIGLKRTLHHAFGIPQGSKLHRRMTSVLKRIIPGNWVAHMIMAVAQKPKHVN